ncbi:MAG TPA: Asp23/Gls24 family envelope stress response protein [Clostridiales bacterium]|nr:Asp23/Gls24 family envelope stress response protein [Clostridiales bacterium]
MANDGSIIFSPDVVATIAGVAATSVEGVAGMSGGIVDGIVDILGMKNFKKGVKVELGTEETIINANIVIKYGYKLNEVCLEVQKKIKNAVETMTGLRVVSVDVSVLGISFDDDTKKKQAQPESSKLK